MIARVKQLAARRPSLGFTLIELMITIAIVAILASIAIPSYRQYIIRGKRSAAKAVMMDIAIREQQFLLANRVYADTGTLVGSGYAVPEEASENYTWAVDVDLDANPAIPDFLITFTPTGAQTSDGALMLDDRGNKTPPDKWKK